MSNLYHNINLLLDCCKYISYLSVLKNAEKSLHEYTLCSKKTASSHHLATEEKSCEHTENRLPRLWIKGNNVVNYVQFLAHSDRFTSSDLSVLSQPLVIYSMYDRFCILSQPAQLHPVQSRKPFSLLLKTVKMEQQRMTN